MAGDPPEPECRIAHVLPDGTPVIRLDGEEHEVELDGIELPQPPADEYFALLDRAARLDRPLRCTVVRELEDGRLRARLSVHGWQDKSGAVWLNLADAAIDQQLARPTGPP